MSYLNRRAQSGFILLILALPGLLFWRWLLHGEVLFWGTVLLQFWPWHSLAKTSALAGEWPLWNPYLGNGAPLLANQQTAFFYPPNLLYFLMPVEQAITLSVVLHLALAGLAMYAYTRSMGLLPFAAAISALAYMLSGYLVGRSQFVVMVNAAAWLPLFLLLAERLVTRPSLPVVAGLGLGLALQLLAGHAQLWFYSLWLVGAYVVFRSWQQAGPQGEPDRLQRAGRAILASLARLAAAVFLAGLVAAVQLLPTAEFVSQSPRSSGAERTFALTYSFWPWRLLTLLAPNFFGSPAQGTYWGYANYWEDHAYIGVLPALLAGMAVLFYYRPARGPAGKTGLAPAAGELLDLPLGWTWPFFAAVVPLSLVLAMGWNTPVYMGLFEWVPGFSFFQAPARLLIWYTVAMAVLAGLGAQVAAVTSRSRRGWQRLLVASLGVAVAAGPGSLLLTGRSRTFMEASLVLGSLLAVSAGLLLAQPTRRRVGLWQAGLVGLVAADLVWAALPLIPTLPASFFGQPISSAGFLQARPDRARFFVDERFDYTTKFDRYFRFAAFGPADPAYWQGLKETLVPNLGMSAGLPAANNFDPLVVGRWQRLMSLSKNGDETLQARLLALMNVGYVIGPALSAVAGQGVHLYQADNLAIRAVPGPLPRAYFVERVYPAGDEAGVINRLTSADFDSRREVIIMLNVTDSNEPAATLAGRPVQPDQGAASRDLLAAGDVPVTIQDHSSGRVELALTAPGPGMVVLTDTFYPGWLAMLDGQPARLWQANLAFRAVAVEAGPHRIEFNYHPQSFSLGLAISSGTLVAITGAGIFWLIKRRLAALS